jgi:hypothetical protein
VLGAAGLFCLLGRPLSAAPLDTWRLAVLAPRSVTAGGPPVSLVVQVRDMAGQPAPDGTLVTVTASLGLTAEPNVAPTTAGRAELSLRPGTEAGFSRLDAQLAGGHVDMVLWVRPAPAARVIDLQAVPVDLAPGGRAIVTGQLTDAFGNLAEGDAVSWTVLGGSLAAASPRVDHGAVRADFLAGDLPGPAELRLTAGAATRSVSLNVVDRGPRPLPTPVWLPLAFAGLRRSGLCENVLANGSFEASPADGESLPGWLLIGGAAPALSGAGAAADGERWLRLAGDAAQPPAVRQALDVGSGNLSGELWLWARGGADAGLKVAIWTVVPLGDSAARAPVLIDRQAVPEDDWVRLAYRLPVAPAGATSVELSPWSASGDPTHIDLDGVTLRICR